MTRVHLMAWVAAALCQIGAASGAIVRVPEDQPTILAGIDASSPGDTVLVGPGTYTTSAIRSVNFGGTVLNVLSCAFLKNGTVLLSESGPSVTMIDLAGVQGGSFAAVVVGGLLPSEGTRVEGFTITGTVNLGDCGGVFAPSGRVTFADCVLQDLGGYGILCDTSALTAEGCEFRNCAEAGVRVAYADVIVKDSHFEECDGGGLRAHCLEGDIHEASIRGCTFMNNIKPGDGGGAAVVRYNPTLVEDCWFEGNSSELNGGALLVGRGSALVRGNVFVGNRVSGSGVGGALLCGYGWAEVVGNTFYGNSQEYQYKGGSAMYVLGVAAVENNAFASNTGNAAVAVSTENGYIQTACNVFWDNPDGDIEGFEPDPTDMFCDPEFCNPEANDFTVSSTSPCLPENNVGCGLIGALGQGCGGVTVERDSWAVIKSKYRRQ